MFEVSRPGAAEMQASAGAPRHTSSVASQAIPPRPRATSASTSLDCLPPIQASSEVEALQFAEPEYPTRPGRLLARVDLERTQPPTSHAGSAPTDFERCVQVRKRIGELTKKPHGSVTWMVRSDGTASALAVCTAHRWNAALPGPEDIAIRETNDKGLEACLEALLVKLCARLEEELRAASNPALVAARVDAVTRGPVYWQDAPVHRPLLTVEHKALIFGALALLWLLLATACLPGWMGQ